MTRRLAVVLGAVAVFAAACSDGGPAATPAAVSVSGEAPSSTVPTSSVAPVDSTTTTAAAAGSTTTTVAPVAGRPYEVIRTTATYADPTRITPAGAETDELPSRTLDVWIDRPDTTAARPLVIFAHGLTGHPRSHELLRESLAAEGFVVVAPAFPLTNNDVPGAFANAGDTGEQVNDVSFLIDAVLADPELAPSIDGTRIGMIGHSLGGITTAGAALSVTGDRRISAAVVISAGYGQARDDVAVMTVHGDADRVVPYASSELSYRLLTGRRVFMTLVGGTHLTGILDDGSELGVALRGVAAAFFAVELGVEEGQVAAIDGLPLDSVTIEAGTAAGPLADWRDYFTG
jgi:dienelactone hydrolase